MEEEAFWFLYIFSLSSPLVFIALVLESIRVVPFLLVLSWLFSTFIGFLINCGADF